VSARGQLFKSRSSGLRFRPATKDLFFDFQWGWITSSGYPIVSIQQETTFRFTKMVVSG
jgi:hypothetical protein